MLAAAGVASRRAAEQLIFAGEVKVNGQVVTLPQTVADPTKDKVPPPPLQAKNPAQLGVRTAGLLGLLWAPLVKTSGCETGVK